MNYMHVNMVIDALKDKASVLSSTLIHTPADCNTFAFTNHRKIHQILSHVKRMNRFAVFDLRIGGGQRQRAKRWAQLPAVPESHFLLPHLQTQTNYKWVNYYIYIKHNHVFSSFNCMFRHVENFRITWLKPVVSKLSSLTQRMRESLLPWWPWTHCGDTEKHMIFFI